MKNYKTQYPNHLARFPTLNRLHDILSSYKYVKELNSSKKMYFC
jgi:hypothetical protein